MRLPAVEGENAQPAPARCACGCSSDSASPMCDSCTAEDKRSRLISLTPMAVRRMPKAKALMDAHVEQALAGFSAQERAQLGALLARVNENVARMGGG
jgi:hypothetical protein